jgi:hypothetical protein
MFRHCLVSYPNQTRKPEAVSFKSLSDLLKKNLEGLFRSSFFFETENAAEALAAAEAQTLPLAGPLTITHAIRRAADILLEDCGYEGMQVYFEVDGKKLPELPSREETLTLLQNGRGLVHIDGKAYKAHTEVFGFQQVYDDTVKTIDALKTLGIGNDAMLLVATPEEISVEVHPGVFGFPEDPRLAERYRSVLFRLTGLKTGDRRTVLKTFDRTVLANTCSVKTMVLVTGGVHPSLHRPKVCVGASHFAYGPAAFSDECGKKRGLEDHLKDMKRWIKFLDTPLTVIPGLVDKFPAPASAPLAELIPAVAPDPATQVTTGSPILPGARTGPLPAAPLPKTESSLQSFKRELCEALPELPQPRPCLSAGGTELNKALGGGWARGGVHLLISGREEGKSSFLLNQALALAPRHGVLFLSTEMRFAEFAQRVLACSQKMSLNDLTAKAGAAGVEGDRAREKLRLALKSLTAGLPDGLFFRGADSQVNPRSVDEVTGLVKLIPPQDGWIILLDGLTRADLEDQPRFVAQLRQKAATLGITVFLAVHAPMPMPARPHLLEALDLEWLDRWQGVADSLTSLTCERVNLKKLLALTQGKVDPAVADTLEKKLYQLSGGGRLRGDTYCFVRVLHAPGGLRQCILYLYQRETGRFWEGPATPLLRA